MTNNAIAPDVEEEAANSRGRSRRKRIAELESMVAQLAATVKQQAAQIKKVSAQLELREPAGRVVANKQ